MSTAIGSSESCSGSSSGGSTSAGPCPIPAPLAVLVFVLATVPFLGSLWAGFVDWDDPLNVTQNPGIRGFSADHLRWMGTAFHVGHWMPLTWLSLAVDHALWGLDPRGYHLTNILLHGLAAVFVQRILTRLTELALPAPGTGPRTHLAAGAFGALFFALHPLRAESVAWITERRDVLSGALLFASVSLYLRGARPGGAVRAPALVGSLALYSASLASKSMGLTLPVVLLLLDAWPLARFAPGPDRTNRVRRALLEKLAFAGPAAAAAFLALKTQAATVESMSSVGEFGIAQRLALSVQALVFYPWKTLLPVGLSPLYALDPDLDPFSGRVALAAALVLAITAAAILVRRRHPALLVAWSAYVVLASPLLGLVQVGHQRAADRYSYLACVPFAALLAGLVAGRLAGRTGRAGPRPSVWVASALVLVVLGAQTVRQVACWRDSLALWERVVAVEPDNPIGLASLGVTRHRAGEFAVARAQYDRALDLLPPGRRADTLHNRALSRVALADLEGARTDLAAAVAERPDHLGALRTLRELARIDGTLDEHRARLEAAVRAAPEDVRLGLELASLHAELQRPDRAQGILLEVLRRAPDAAEAHGALGALLLGAGETDEARAHLERAVRADPFNVAARTFLGRVLDAQGQPEAARAAWRRALELEPDYEPALRALAAGP